MEKQKIVILEKQFFVHPVFTNYAASKDGEIVNLKKMKPFKGNQNKKTSYSQFTINLGNRKFKCYTIHRFVWEAIKGPIPEDFEINHKNRIKTDNRIKNLELVTHQQNIDYSVSKKVISVNQETKEEKIFISISLAGKELGIDNQNICAICRKKYNRQKAKSKVDNNWYSFKYVDYT